MVCFDILGADGHLMISMRALECLQRCINIFFHVFIAYDILFTMFVVMLTNMETAATHVDEMSQSGFHRAVGSTDATHIVMEKCHHNLKQYHMSPKVKQKYHLSLKHYHMSPKVKHAAARTYNLTMNHMQQILTTSGHPAQCNDRSIIIDV